MDYCGTFCNGLLFYFIYIFFPSALEGAFSIASTVSAKTIVILLKSSLINSLAEGLDIPSKLFRVGRELNIFVAYFMIFLYKFLVHHSTQTLDIAHPCGFALGVILK